MKKSEHPCAACAKPVPVGLPFCVPCWRRVPKELRDRVRAALQARGTEALDRSEIYHAVTAAAASVRESPAEMSEGALYWQLVYMKAGSPKLEDVNRRRQSRDQLSTIRHL